MVAIPATKTPATSVRDSGMRRKATKVMAADIQPAANMISPNFLKKLIHVVIKYPLSKSRYLPSIHPDSEKFRGSSSQSHCSPQFPLKTLRFTESKNLTPQHHSRHRENIGRIGSLGVFCEMSVIAVFPLKTGYSMFVGFDSQNTFPKYISSKSLSPLYRAHR